MVGRCPWRPSAETRVARAVGQHLAGRFDAVLNADPVPVEIDWSCHPPVPLFIVRLTGCRHRLGSFDAWPNWVRLERYAPERIAPG